jgi:cell division septation protein DedD
MTAITASVRTHRRSLAVIGAIVVIALAVLALVLVMTSPTHDMHHVVSAYHHLPHFLQALLGAQHLGA